MCKNCNLYMHISHKSSHLSSNYHKNHHNKVWCEDCNKYISDKTGHLQSEIHLRNKQTNQQNTQIASGTQHPSVQFDNNT